MKRSVITLLILFIACAGTLWAQEQNQDPDNESDYYVKTVPISKVYIHQLGYRIVYQKSNMNFGVFYVPNSWFQYKEDEPPKAELVTENSKAVPYFSIFWQDGEFDHIRLYLHRNLSDISYGDLENPEKFNDRFDIQSLDLEF